MLISSRLLYVSLLLLTSAAFGAYKDTIRHTELANELNLRGISVPTGSGVSVTQVEAGTVSNYLADINNSEFSGKTITARSGASGSLGHATTVGKNLYGNTTGIAIGITQIDGYQADDFLNNNGWGTTGTPSTENNPLQNHSYIGNAPSSAYTLKMDYAVDRDGFLPIAGLNNGSGTTVPTIYGSMYNGITVGLSNGEHSRGGTVNDTAGRTKPEIVSDSNLTSYATPHVTAAAALLIESAGNDDNAKDQLTLKAILLAGANKSPFPSWDQTTNPIDDVITSPIDDVYGAGQLDVYENHFIQQAGQQTTSSMVDERGWNLSSVSNSSSETYTINVPAGFELRNLSALITWNRDVTRTETGGGPFKTITYTPSLANLSLSLTGAVSQSSDSPVENIEHIWRDSSNALVSDSYTLTVASSSSTSTEYALAWRSELYQDYSLWSSASFTASTPVDQRDADDDPDADGIKNLLEQAFGGDPEAQDLDILPISETIEDNGQSYLQISYRKPEFENGLTYTVETVTDLNGTWSSLSSEVELISIVSESGGFDRYTYRLVDPISATDKAFLRVEISETP